MTVNRNAIHIEKKSDFSTGRHFIYISVKIGDKEYKASYSGDGQAREAAIRSLVDLIMRREIGIVEHDIAMMVYSFEERNRRNNEV